MKSYTKTYELAENLHKILHIFNFKTWNCRKNTLGIILIGLQKISLIKFNFV